LLLAQVRTTAVALVTVKLAVHVFGASQSDVTVNVTVVAPPQADGAPILLLVKIRLQPPLAVVVASQFENLVLIVD